MISFQQIRILVVDDSVHMRKIVRTLLHSFGVHEIHEAEDGAAALEVFHAHAPDIVITDWEMPLLDGAEMVRMIRNPKLGNPAYTPIIMLSAYSEHRRVTDARDLGVNEFLCKPVSARALYHRLHSVICHPRPFVRTETYFGPCRRRNSDAKYSGPERRRGGKAEITQLEVFTAA